MLVKDIMTKKVISVEPETSVREVAQLLVEFNLKGVPVVDKEEGVVGVITECDLILQNAKLHIPTFIHILDGVLTLGQKETEEELRKITGAMAKEVMSSPAVTVEPDMLVEDIASLMWEKKINPVPIVKDGKLVGVVSRADIVKLLANS